MVCLLCLFLLTAVFEILRHFVEHGNWKEAFISIIPKRKGAEARGEDGKQVEEAAHEDTSESDESEGEEEHQDD